MGVLTSRQARMGSMDLINYIILTSFIYSGCIK